MKTINLKDYRTNPNGALYIFLGVLALLFLVNAFVPAQPEAQSRSAFIYILSTPAPTAPLPTADMTLAVENAQLRARIAELEQERNAPAPTPVYQEMSAPEAPTAPGYVAHTTAGDIVIPNDATPVPAGQPYTGPFLAPQLPTPIGPRLCDGFGDWRDYDAMYETSPACHK